MIRWVTALARIGLVVAAIAATVPMIAFAQTSESAIESVPTEAEEVNASPTGDDMSDETDPPSRSVIPAEVEAEFQRLFTQHRSELLDDRAAYIDRWLAVIAVVLTFFGIVVAVTGVLGFRRFREIETEAGKSVARIEQLLSESEANAQSIRRLTAEFAADNPEEANQAVQNVRGNPEASLTDRVMVSAVSLQQQGKTDEAIEKWRALALITEGSDNDLAALAWFSVGYLRKDKDPKGCVSAYDEAIRLKPDFAEAYNNRGNAKTDLGQYEAAVADFDEAIRLQPDFANAYSNRGNAKADLGQYEAAVADYDEAIRLRPAYAAAYFRRGLAKVGLKIKDAARKDFEIALELARNANNAEIVAQAEHALRDLDDAADS